MLSIVILSSIVTCGFKCLFVYKQTYFDHMFEALSLYLHYKNFLVLLLFFSTICKNFSKRRNAPYDTSKKKVAFYLDFLVFDIEMYNTMATENLFPNSSISFTLTIAYSFYVLSTADLQGIS